MSMNESATNESDLKVRIKGNKINEELSTVLDDTGDSITEQDDVAQIDSTNKIGEPDLSRRKVKII